MDDRKMQRVSKRMPCPVCEKPDWCLVAEDGSAAICQRTQEGSVKRCGDAGWLHILRDGLPKCSSQKVYSKRLLDNSQGGNKCFEELAVKYQHQITSDLLETLSGFLGVTITSLKRLRAGWDEAAYTFPMSNHFGNVIGIHRRFPDGRKVSVTGSKAGLFLPAELAEGMMFICEGPTDTAAALDLGFNAIGRPNCNSLIEMTAGTVRGRGEIVIIADNDHAGRAGAGRLADILALHCNSVKIVCPPNGIKDLRQWLHTGLDRVVLFKAIDQVNPIEIKITFKD